MTKETYLTSKGVEVKSKEELYFSWWLDELEDNGIIESYGYEPKTFKLSDAAHYTKTVQMKTKSKIVTRTLLQPHSYTPDFQIHWHKDMDFIHSWCGLSWVDVKGGYSKNFNDTAFPLNQKWMYDKFGIYVEKVVSGSSTYKNSKKELVIKKGLFAKTFTPKRYLLTDKSNKPRKINFKVTLLEDIL